MIKGAADLRLPRQKIALQVILHVHIRPVPPSKQIERSGDRAGHFEIVFRNIRLDFRPERTFDFFFQQVPQTNTDFPLERNIRLAHERFAVTH